MSRGRRSTRREAEHEQLLRRGTVDHYRDTALYDFEYADRSNDLSWYRKLARERAPTEPILELGAGTGRITCPLARDGHSMVALDSMKPMLAALRRRAKAEGLEGSIRTTVADMRQLPIPDASMGMVISPFNALMHLYTWQDLLTCFREVERVLVPGGTFAFDVELPDLEWLTWDEDERYAVTPFTHPETGAKLVYSTNHRYDPGTQVCHIKLYYDEAPTPGRRFVPPPQPLKLVHLAHRQVFPEEIRLLVATAGLRLESHTGDFEDVALGPGVQSQVVVARRDEGETSSEPSPTPST
ncbi:class I SAM-dependent methyltransferase [Paraliomyxa miuraensis]|uniref:class I SAM-dependent methyltransferase n=1 Tax=Paraliomyxa miuraensis TaxID=376150 RepID=UPI0022557E59|nr:class I SAM-dependent methyltransferase [Paraliomyxa miuraensis]MCX4246919.1 class I SAM-dependent methyltransferase [Paraliomyxa miuraensis]